MNDETVKIEPATIEAVATALSYEDIEREMMHGGTLHLVLWDGEMGLDFEVEGVRRESANLGQVTLTLNYRIAGQRISGLAARLLVHAYPVTKKTA